MPTDPTCDRSRLWETLNEICDCGGRLAGTESEFTARDAVAERLDSIDGVRRDHVFTFEDWQPGPATAVLQAGSEARRLDVVPLPGAPPTLGPLTLPVRDDGASDSRPWAGCAVLTDHTYPFRRDHVHRRTRYRRACERGARTFLIANDQPGTGPVTGGVGGQHDVADIPALGLSHESGALVRAATRPGPAHIWLDIAAHRQSWAARNLILEIPGRSDEWVVLCAHLDGHALAESAVDNATGIAVMIEIGRVLADSVPTLRCGLRLIAFTVEERGLVGSRRYVAQLPEQERRRIRCAIALDALTGDSRLAALTGGDPWLENLVRHAATECGTAIDVVTEPLANSDHYSFHEAGIPAMRLMSGYGDAGSSTRHVLTSRDRRTIVDRAKLSSVAAVATRLVRQACAAPGRDVLDTAGSPDGMLLYTMDALPDESRRT